jgi:hypothetical protein
VSERSSFHNYELGLTGQAEIVIRSSIVVYVLGDPGTPYHIDRTWSESASATLAEPVSAYDIARGSAGLDAVADVRSKAGTLTYPPKSYSDSEDGVSQSPTILCYGSRYSLAAGELPSRNGYAVGATLWDYETRPNGVAGNVQASLQVSLSAYRPGQDD